MEDRWKKPEMADEIYIHEKNADGHEISGTYKVYPDTIVVMFGKRRKSEQRDHRLSAADQAKFILYELDRKSRGKS